MFSFFKKKQAAAVFEVDSPKLSITPNPHNLKSSLKNAEIDYKVVTDGFITFAGCVFDSDIPLMIGIHFNLSKIEYIEIFRTPKYYQSEKYDINRPRTDFELVCCILWESRRLLWAQTVSKFRASLA